MIKIKTQRSQKFDVSTWQDAWGLVAMLTLGALAARMAYIALWQPYGLAPDEAQYWSWLAHNDWSFLTKPPLTTWLIGLSTAVLGQTMLGVKLFALLGQAAVSLLGFAIAREIGGKAAGWWAWALLTTVPVVAAGGLIMSPDAVLLPLWLGALLAVVRGLKMADDKALCWGRWLIVGGLIGLGGLAKYSAAFFYPLLGVYLLVWRRSWLLKPQIWVSGVVALAFQVPVLLWNMQHDWVGVSHVLWQADGGGDGRHGGIWSVMEFVGGQALVLGPVVFGLVLVAMAGAWKEARTRWLALVFVAVMAGFAVMALGSKVQANWPVLGAVSGLLVLAVWLANARRWVVYVAVAGVLVNLVLSVMLMDTYKFRDLGLLPLAAKNDPTKDLRGWQEMGELVGLLMYKLDNPVVLSTRYQTLAPLMFHTIGNPEFAYVNAEGKRANQYDLWPLPELTGRIVVYVNERGVLPEKVRAMFGECTPWHTLGVEEYGVQVRKMSLWICWSPRTIG